MYKLTFKYIERVGKSHGRMHDVILTTKVTEKEDQRPSIMLSTTEKI